MDDGKTPGFMKRMSLATVNVLVTGQVGALVIYFTGRFLGWDEWALIESLGYILPWLLGFSVLLLPLVLWRRSRLLLGMTLGGLVLFLGIYGRLFIPNGPVESRGVTFTVMTYNVLYKNSDIDATLGEIEKHDPDVLALHEYVEGVSEQMDPELSRRYPYQKVEAGSGFYSRFPILDYRFTRIGQGEQQLLIEIEGRPVTVYSIHPNASDTKAVPVPGLPTYFPVSLPDSIKRRAQFELILANLEQIEGPLVLVGDLNITDQNPIHQTLSGVLEDAFLERGRGFGFTFSSFSRYPIPFSRIDYVFHSPELIAVDAQVGDYGGSDHKPVVATLAINETAVP